MAARKPRVPRPKKYVKPDGTPSQKGLYIDKSGQPVLNYWDLDADGWRNATGKVQIKI